MNVYDFDKTIYRNDSSVDLFCYLCKRHPRMMLDLPRMAFAAAAYLCHFISKTKMKEIFYASFRHVSDIEKEVEAFWQEHADNIFSWYPLQQREDDLIISASPEFSIRVACRKLGIQHYLASRVDAVSGKTQGLNCYGEEKVKRFKQAYPHEKIEKFYSDSYSDAPLAFLAKEAFLVRQGKVEKWPEGKR